MELENYFDFVHEDVIRALIADGVDVVKFGAGEPDCDTIENQGIH